MAETGGTVSVPVVGKQPKKLVVGGLLVVSTAVVIYYVRSKKAAAAPAAAAASTPADQYPADGTSGNPSDLYSTDPATGQTYGDELAGSGGTLGAFGSGAASGQYYDPATGAYDLTAPYGTQPVTQPFQTQGGPPFSSNATWSDWVIQELQAQNPSIDVGALTDALGEFLNGQGVTTAQKTLIFDATAIGGSPPVAGASGYPPKIMALASAGGGTTAPPTTGPVTGVPVVTIPVTFGESANTAIGKIEKAGLTVSTSPVRSPQSTYVSTGSSPEGGRKVARGSHVVLNVKVS
jgi:hypothetical protein